MLLRIWRAIIDAVGRLSRLETRFIQLQESADEQRAALLLVVKALGAIQASLDHIIDLLEPGPAVKIIFIADLEGQLTYGVTMLEIRDDQKCLLSIQPVDKKGNPAAVDGIPEWFTSNTDLLAIDPAADGLSATVSAIGPLGSGVISVKADADLGEGVTPLAGALEVLVVGGSAVTIAISPGTPEDQ